MRILAVDTCLAACQVAVTDGETVRAAISEPMLRGHQERLAPMVREAMEAAGLAFADLDRVAVTVGPGSFTGLRVGLAFAKGLAAALSIPAVGVGTLDALAGQGTDNTIPVIDAKRGFIYAQLDRDAETCISAGQFALDEIAAPFAPHLRDGPIHLIGPGAGLLAPYFPAASIDPRPAPDITILAGLASDTWPAGPAPLFVRDTLTPLYLRAPDAKLPGAKLPGGREP